MGKVSGVATGGLQPPSIEPQMTSLLTSFSDIYFEVLDILSLIIWFCDYHIHKNLYLALFPEFRSLPLCL